MRTTISKRGVRSSGSPDCHVAHSAELSARRHLWARCARTCQRQVDLHRNRSQGRQSEQCGFGLVHNERRQQGDFDPDWIPDLEGQAHQAWQPSLVWIGTADGPGFIGRAEITPDPGAQQKILSEMHEKYWENRVMGVGPSAERFKSGDRIAIIITPVRDLPDGFSSSPGTPAPTL